ncbi:MAG: DNA mismatch repair protein MutS [Epsilonproteobacteria bacterium]|nr:DNA mismatch repair protein MutS [Campylobacterota bacterium]
MQFSSILFEQSRRPQELPNELDIYKDLNLDQIIDKTVAFKKEFDIKKFFYMPLDNEKIITYRQNILKDLQNNEFYHRVDEFAQKMLEIKKQQKIIETIEYKEYKNGWFLQMASVYCEALDTFLKALRSADLHSSGFLLFYDYLQTYLNSDEHKSLQNDVQKLKTELASVSYEIGINGLTFKVRKYDDEIDYAQEIERVFHKFEQDEVSVQDCQFDKNSGINHVNAKILEFVGKLYPLVFSNLENFAQKHKEFIEKSFWVFANEVEFFISYIYYISKINSPTLSFSYPKMSMKSRSIDVLDGFDISLAYSLAFEKKLVVTNSYYLKEKERVMVISGANQGGKSTFTRAFGQMSYLSKLGLSVPAREAKLFLVDNIFTHFEKEEEISTLHSKLEEDLVRVHDIFDKATTRSLIILNEIFSSTSLQDAIFLSEKTMEKIDKLDLLCIWVTFIEKVNNMSAKTVSMISDIDKQDIEHRTYKIIRKEADGLAYAKSIAAKYHLNYKQILQRVKG